MATDINWTDVVELATELADPAVTTGAQAIILAYVNKALNTRKFTAEALKLARINLAAHIATMAAADPETTGSATAGAVVSESVGGIARTYSAIGAAVGGSDLSESSYGTMFEFLVRTSRARLPFVLKGPC